MEIIKFLKSYDITTFAIFLTFSSLIIKGVITFFDWAYERLEKVYGKKFNQITEK